LRELCRATACGPDDKIELQGYIRDNDGITSQGAFALSAI